MSNQLFSNDTAKYPISGDEVSILGLPLTSYINQPVKTNSNVSFTSATMGVTTSTVVIAPDYRSVGTMTLSPGVLPTYQYLPPQSVGTGIRQRVVSASGQVTFPTTLNLVFSGIQIGVGTVEIQTQYVSTAGSFINQYGSTRQITRFTNTSGTVVPGSNLLFLIQRDAGLTPGTAGTITITGGVNSLTISINGLVGETLLTTCTAILYT